MEKTGAHIVWSASRSSFLNAVVLFCCFLFSYFCLVSSAAVITVPGDYATIQAAIDASTHGDEIIVSPGTYLENIRFNGKNIILRSTEPTNPSVVSTTIIDGNQADSVVTFSGSEEDTCVLSGFTITNGYQWNGGGVSGNATMATLKNNTISGNSARDDGGGLYKCDGVIENNMVSDNSAGDGGGGLYHCHGIVKNNTISENSAQYYGGGLNRCDGTIQNNAITGNLGSSGGGLISCDGIIQNNVVGGNVVSGNEEKGGGLSWCHGLIQNNTIYGNVANLGAGLYDCDGTIRNNTVVDNTAMGYEGRGGGLYECHGFIINCVIWSNSASAEGSQLHECNIPFHCCIQDWTGAGRGNISPEPKFVDAANRNYHLQINSPCIDQGNTFYLFAEYLADIDGECRVAGSSVDMGSDEFNSSPDSDGDLLSDNDETLYGSNPGKQDSDEDGLIDGAEQLRGTNPALHNLPIGISIPTDFSSIQQGIFLAFPAEVITLSPGTYHENLRLSGKNLTLQGIAPLNDDIVSSTTIDGDRLSDVMTFQGTEDRSCVIQGLTIQNGKYSGICGNHTGTTIKNNIIKTNSDCGVYQCHGTIKSNTIFDNSGRGLAKCDGTIQNNTIFSNSGGIYNCDGAIMNNAIYGNSANRGGGLRRCYGTLLNNTIYGNSASQGGGLHECHGFIIHCILWGNSASEEGDQLYDHSPPLYCCIQDWTQGGRDNISSNPQFANPAMGDFHLQSDSPCIDAGNTFYVFGDHLADLDGECRVAGSSVDLGCDEYGSLPDTDGDLLADSDEAFHGSNPQNPDTDGDNLKDGIEVMRGADPAVPDTPEGISIPANYSTVQQGLFLAFPGEDITVSPGMYNENLIFLGKNLTLQSTNPLEDDIVGMTTIDGGQMFPVISFLGTENETCAVKGLTIRNGRGGIWGRTASPIIENNRILDNAGGGVWWCNGVIQNNIISHNSASYGGGLSWCWATIQNNIITNNLAEEEGGGLWMCYGTIQNNIVWGNSAHYGGGLCFCTAYIRNCIIWQNSAPHYPQIASSASHSYSCIQDWTSGGTGNISDDPLFVDPDNGDFRLLDTSPCIDAGNPDVQYNDACLPPGKGAHRNDMGAYGGPENCRWLDQILQWNFDETLHDWQFHAVSPTDAHVDHWQDAFPTVDAYSLSIFSPYDESTNYFALWDSMNAEPIPFTTDSLYRVDWFVSTDRSQPDFSPGFRLRIGLRNQKAFSFLRLYPGNWLPLTRRPEFTKYQLFFEPPIADDLFLGFSLIDWADDFRQTSPAGVIFVEELSVYRYSLEEFGNWHLQALLTDFSSWIGNTVPFYESPTFEQTPQSLSLSSGIDASRVFGCWDSPTNRFAAMESKVYRVRCRVSSSPQYGGPELRVRIHTDDFRYSWYTHYISSYTPGESPLPPEEGANYDLYFTLPFSTQPCHFSFDLLDFSSTFGGSLALHELSLHSHPF